MTDASAKLRALTTDRIMLAALGLCSVAAVGIGALDDGLALASIASAVVCAATLAVWLGWPGSLASRLTLAAALMTMVSVQIDVGHGATELHFGVFVVLGILLMYLDWRPILMAAGAIAVQHIVADRLQAAGAGVYCTSTPSFPKVLLHATYVILQSGAEIYMAVWLSASAAREQGIAQTLNATLATLRDALATTSQSVSSIEGASNRIAQGNADLSQRTDKTASQLQQVSDSMERLSMAARSNAESAIDANRHASATATVAELGGNVVREVVAKMEDITRSSLRISDIIAVIDGIAFQTNILALNAAVEAARAGEQGRGFAVVASEVRSLAQRSAVAAREIKALIGTSVDTVQSGSRLAGEAGKTMEEVVAGVRSVAGIIDQMTSSTTDQSQGIAAIHRTVTELDRMTQQNAELVEQSAAAADSLQVQARRLTGVVSSFKL